MKLFAGGMTEYLLVDGYNIIYMWPTLKALADTSLDHARIKLLDILSNHQGFTRNEIIVVFDAHKVHGGVGSVEQWGDIRVIYTKEAETADSYIERAAAVLAKRYRVRVATSDGMEQIIIIGHGALRVSAIELKHEIDHIKSYLREQYINNKPIKKNMLLDNLDSKTAEKLEKMRYKEV